MASDNRSFDAGIHYGTPSYDRRSCRPHGRQSPAGLASIDLEDLQRFLLLFDACVEELDVVRRPLERCLQRQPHLVAKAIHGWISFFVMNLHDLYSQHSLIHDLL